MRKSHLLVVAVLLTPAVARATCHLMEVVEIFGGTDAEPNAHYVVLRMNAAGQTLVSGNTITTDGGTFATFSSDVSSSASGSRILAATAEAATLFGITADQTADGTLDFPSGTVTHDCSADTVAYGTGAIPALIRGCALKKSGTTWALGDPSPTNNAGTSAPLSTCVLPDGGSPDPVADGGTGGGGGGCSIASRAPGGASALVLLALVALSRRRRS